MSEYGKRAAYKIAYELAGADVIVVSGMALGIDSVAACGALSAEGKTVAVLGCGIDVVYPKEHRKLQRIIENKGLVITEFAPGTRPIGVNFPIRNRIISGVSQGTFVVEADDKSGAMITARTALAQGRDIFALPGNIDESNAIGTNQLIKDGATAVISVEDILNNYEPIYAKKINYSGLAFSKTAFVYSEDVFDKMGIASRTYGSHKIAKKADSSEFRPKLKPVLEIDDKDMPTTVEKIESKKLPKRAAPHKDGSEELLSQMDEMTRNIFAEIPMDRATSIEKLCALGYTVGDITTALTMLEIHGLVSSLPGGLYIKR
jgi:DNA protecting protein DprA